VPQTIILNIVVRSRAADDSGFRSLVRETVPNARWR
jgi:hypothetical protein